MALQISKGEYIAILEGDDFWPSDKLKIQIDAMRESDAILSWGMANIIDREGNLLDVLPKNIKQFAYKSREDQLLSLLFANPMHSCTIICRKRALISAGGFKQPEMIPCVDGPTWLEMSLSWGVPAHRCGIGMLPEARQPDNISDEDLDAQSKPLFSGVLPGICPRMSGPL